MSWLEPQPVQAIGHDERPAAQVLAGRQCFDGCRANSALSLLTSHLKSTQASSARAGNAAAAEERPRRTELPNCGSIAWANGSYRLGIYRSVNVPSKASAANADGLRQRRMGMDGQTNIRRIGTHLNGERHFGDQLAGVGADDAPRR